MIHLSQFVNDSQIAEHFSTLEISSMFTQASEIVCRLTLSNKIESLIHGLKLGKLSTNQAKQVRELRKNSSERAQIRDKLYKDFKKVAERIELSLFENIEIHSDTVVYLEVDPKIANFPFEGFQIFQSLTVKRILHKFINGSDISKIEDKLN